MTEFRHDVDRRRRQGFPEVVYGEHKSVEQLRAVLAQMTAARENTLVTRLGEAKAQALLEVFPQAVYHGRSETMTILHGPPLVVSGTVAVLAAGTSDARVAHEAADTLRFAGVETKVFIDVGVAGLNRLLSVLPQLESCSVIICVAGFEGALASVVGGLVAQPVIAVPTSVGYGVAAGGLAALHAMLASCASGLTVVNIDNGFGAALAAYRILNRG